MKSELQKILDKKYRNDTLEKRFERVLLSVKAMQPLTFNDACYIAYGEKKMDEINRSKN